MKKNRRLLSTSAILALLLLALIALGAIYWFQTGLKPVSADTQTTLFIIKKGQSLDSVGADLEAKNLIRSRAVFKLLVAKEGLSKKIQAGSFRLSPSQTTPEVLSALTHGTNDFWVTILEGWRREEVAAALAAAFAGQGLSFDEPEFLKLTQDQEGYLYPDTYLIPVSADAAFVASLLQKTFDQKTAGLDFASSNLTQTEVLTLASLVEREAKTDNSRKLVAGILLNRLQIGMPLQVDATLQYAKGFNATKDSWWEPPLAADKAISSPYNTYANPGLPPGPIASPSLSSIQAVLSPTPSGYLYYITGADGQMYYAQTLDQHNANLQTHL